MSDKRGTVHLVVALMAEAKPLIRHFNLAPVANAYPFNLYQNDWLSLIVSGIGKLAAASACGVLYQFTGAKKDHVWLNIGISGAKNADLGSLWFASKVLDASSGLTWYPQFTWPVEISRTTVTTVDHASTVEDSHTLYDMEAAGFCAACSKFSSLELIHVLKIVSDNQDSSFTNLNKHVIETLITNQLESIEASIFYLRKLVNQQQRLYQAPSLFADCLERWHFTITQRHQLTELLRRWWLLCPNRPIWPELAILPNAKTVIQTLFHKVEAAALTNVD